LDQWQHQRLFPRLVDGDPPARGNYDPELIDADNLALS
jgi:hypothetical protein